MIDNLKKNISVAAALALLAPGLASGAAAAVSATPIVFLALPAASLGVAGAVSPMATAPNVLALPAAGAPAAPLSFAAALQAPAAAPLVADARADLVAQKLQGVMATGAAADLESWIAAEKKIALLRMLANVSPAGAVKGSVAASPSRENPNYWYNWKRDAALTMNVVANLHARAADAEEKRMYLQLLTDYAEFTRRIQNTRTLTGEGEPKVNMDGSAFDGPWGRPQNDGPAEEASTLMAFIDLLPRNVEDAARRLYGDFNIGIKKALEYVSHRWQNSGFDLWEEVKGLHFDTLMAQRTALLEGAALADRLGDPGAADWYRKQARLIEAKMSEYWDSRRGYIVSTLHRDEGIDYKNSGLDSAVILAVVHRRVAGDDFASVTDEKVLATAQALKQKFMEIYPINRRADIPGVAIGRYPEDRYFGGNPWIIPTNALAQLYFTAAKSFRDRGFIDVTPVNLAFFKDVVKTGADKDALRPGTKLSAGDILFDRVLRGLRDGGDELLARIKFHANPDGSLSEQMDKNSGYMTSAADLTWNYASLLSALQAREDLERGTAAVREQRDRGDTEK